MNKVTGIISLDENGQMKMTNRKRFDEYRRALKPGLYEFTLKKKNRRSTPQNRYYWGVVIEEIRFRLLELGTRAEPEEIHELLKLKFNVERVTDKDGTVLVEIGQSTTDMNKEEFEGFCESVRQWAAEILSIRIPLPNENLAFNYE